MAIADYDSAYDYAVVRDHDGELARIDSKINDGTLSFSTDKFSTYTIVKAEKAATGTEAANLDKQMLAKNGRFQCCCVCCFSNICCSGQLVSCLSSCSSLESMLRR